MKQAPIDKLKMMLAERPFILQTPELVGETVKLLKFIDHYSDRFLKAKGSTHNHQAWEGGYIDHLLTTLNEAYNIYQSMINQKADLNVTILEVKRVIFFHDIEKLFKQPGDVLTDDYWKYNFLEHHLDYNFDIHLTTEELDAIKYIHGEGNDYRKDKRVMSELCAICHCADVLSARVLWDCKVT